MLLADQNRCAPGSCDVRRRGDGETRCFFSSGRSGSVTEDITFDWAARADTQTRGREITLFKAGGHMSPPKHSELLKTIEDRY